MEGEGSIELASSDNDVKLRRQSGEKKITRVAIRVDAPGFETESAQRRKSGLNGIVIESPASRGKGHEVPSHFR